MANRWIETALFGLRKIRNGLGGQDMPQRNTLEFRGATVSDNPVDGTTVVEINADLGTATPNATPNTIAKRNALGNCAFNDLQVVDLTASGEVSASGDITSTTGGLSVAANATFGASVSAAGSVQAGGALTGANLVMTGISSVITSGTTVTISGNSGATPMLTLNASSGVHAFSGTAATAPSFRIVGAVTYTHYIDLTGLYDTTGTAEWAYDTSTAPSQWKNTGTGAKIIQFPISDFLVNGATLVGATIMIAPNATSHYPPTGAEISANRPVLRLKHTTPSSNTELTFASAVDASANAGDYTTPHIIGISGQTEVINKATKYYLVEFQPEQGASALPGTRIRYITVTCTIPSGYTLLPI